MANVASRDELAAEIDMLRRSLEGEMAEVEHLRADCPICGHKWRQHDPEDGQCDAAGDEIGPCRCGRDLPWMQTKIVALSREALDG